MMMPSYLFPRLASRSQNFRASSLIQRMGLEERLEAVWFSRAQEMEGVEASTCVTSQLLRAAVRLAIPV